MDGDYFRDGNRKSVSDAYSPDYDWSGVTNAGEIRKGGTGYCIKDSLRKEMEK